MLLHHLFESYETTIRAYNGEYEVFRNPSRKEFVDLLNQTEFGFAKAVILENSDLLMWDANLIHDLTPYGRDCIARLELSMERIDWRHARMHPSRSADGYYNFSEAAWLIVTNRYLQRLYPQFAADMTVRDEDINKYIRRSDFTRPPHRFRS